MPSFCRWLFLALLLVGCTAREDAAAPTVLPSVARVHVDPIALTEGDSVELHATLFDGAGRPITGLPVEWAVLDPGVLAIDGAQRLVALAPGTTEIRAESAGQLGRAEVTVRRAEVATVAVQPAALDLDPTGEAELLAVARDDRGRILTDREVVWSSSDPAVVGVDEVGFVQAVGPGHARITAAIDGTVGFVEVRVAAPDPVVIRVEPASVSLVVGEEAQLVPALVRFDGSVATDTLVSFTSSDPAILSVDGAGRIHALAVGVASVGVSAGPVFTSVPVQIDPQVVASVEVIAPDRTVFVDESMQLRAIARDAAGRVVEGKVPRWSAIQSRSLSVNQNGEVRGTIEGTGLVRATIDGAYGAVGLFVRDRVARIDVRQLPSTVVFGERIQPSAQAYNAAGRSLQRTISMDSSDPAVVARTSAGFVATGPGTATLRFQADEVVLELPVEVASPVVFHGAAAGLNRTCALDDTGAPWCWGYSIWNTYFPDGTLAAPRPWNTELRFVELAMGEQHLCGRTATGEAWCAGVNDRGQLGIGPASDSTDFVPVASDVSFASLSGGGRYTCGVATDGRGFCWGANDSGQLGTGDNFDRAVPTLVAGGHLFARLRASASPGGRTTCGVTTAGEGLCWGDNQFGQLGDGTTSPSSLPIAVGGGHTFADVIPASFVDEWELGFERAHACGLATDGSAWCWGRNRSGELGDGTRTDRLLPGPVRGGHLFAELATTAGNDASCGRTAAGAVWCWGTNGYWQLGITDTTVQTLPVRAEGIGPVQEISLGLGHTCAREIDGPLYCWGYNGGFQVGAYSDGYRAPPLKVIGQP